ncbi:MAG: radical SAM protein [Lachnospiraceae bacterium]|nr:radical SAM protein [Lachnospiraceae bacterium]
MCSTPSESPACAETVPYRRKFSVVYVEDAALSYQRTREILGRLHGATVIRCRSYRDIFNRSHQEPTLQRKAQALILAVSPLNAVYDGAPVCQDFGNRHFYYTSCVMNCIFDCEYCYLQGMYPCGHIVCFVNLEDTFAALDDILKEHEAYVCISYDTDLLALEPLLGFVRDWLAYASTRERLTLELRTKSAAAAVLRSLPVIPGAVLALTLSPDPVIAAYEHHTPDLSARLAFAAEAQKAGWSVRLCFDPMLAVHDAEPAYNAMFDEVFSVLRPEQIRDVSIGTFRISKEYLREMRRRRPCAVTLYPYELTNGVYSYSSDTEERLLSLARTRLREHFPEDRIFVWKSDSAV